MASSGLTERVKAALRQRPIYYAFSALLLLAGVALLSALDAPKWLVIAFLIAAWATLLSLLRWRKP